MIGIKKPVAPTFAQHSISLFDVHDFECKQQREQRINGYRDKLIALICIFSGPIFLSILTILANIQELGMEVFAFKHLGLGLVIGIPLSMFLAPFVYALLNKLFPSYRANETYTDRRVKKYKEKEDAYKNKRNLLMEKYPRIERFDFDELRYTQWLVNNYASKYLVNYAKEAHQKQQDRQRRQWWIELDPFVFEEEIADWYKMKGYKVILTPKSGDGGVDVILQKNGETIFVQCKHYAAQVPIGVLRELFGVMRSRQVQKGVLACLYGVSSEGYSFAQKNGISIITLNDLVGQYNFTNTQDFALKYFNDHICSGLINVRYDLFDTEDNLLNKLKIMPKFSWFYYGAYKHENVYLLVYGQADHMEHLRKYLKQLWDSNCERVQSVSTYSRRTNYKRRSSYWRNRYKRY